MQSKQLFFIFVYAISIHKNQKYNFEQNCFQFKLRPRFFFSVVGRGRKDMGYGIGFDLFRELCDGLNPYGSLVIY